MNLHISMKDNDFCVFHPGLAVNPCCWVVLVWWWRSGFIPFPFPHLFRRLLILREAAGNTDSALDWGQRAPVLVWLFQYWYPWTHLAFYRLVWSEMRKVWSAVGGLTHLVQNVSIRFVLTPQVTVPWGCSQVIIHSMYQALCLVPGDTKMAFEWKSWTNPSNYCTCGQRVNIYRTRDLQSLSIPWRVVLCLKM